MAEGGGQSMTCATYACTEYYCECWIGYHRSSLQFGYARIWFSWIGVWCDVRRETRGREREEEVSGHVEVEVRRAIIPLPPPPPTANNSSQNVVQPR